MYVLSEEPYLLPFDALITVRATAHNSYGFATQPSDINTVGVRIKREPDQMAPPFELSSTDSTIVVQWSALVGVETGFSEILSYNLYWDDGSNDLSIELCDKFVN